MFLVNSGGEISNLTIASTLAVNLRAVQSIHKKLEDIWNIDATIKRVPKDKCAVRTVRVTEFVFKVRMSEEEDPTKSSGPCRFISTIMRNQHRAMYKTSHLSG